MRRDRKYGDEMKKSAAEFAAGNAPPSKFPVSGLL
jgi:hypothetical protein